MEHVELLVWKIDRSQIEIDATGGYAFTKGDVQEIHPSGYAWSPLLFEDPNYTVLISTIFPTHAEALLMTAIYSPTRPREYYITLDALDVTQEISQTDLIANTVKK